MRQLVVAWLAACILLLFTSLSGAVTTEKTPTSTSAPTAAFRLDERDGTPDPDVVKEAQGLLSKTEYAGVTVHFMPQKVENPDCYVVTFEEKRHGGQCNHMDGGMPFCAVKNYVFPNHPDCLDREPESKKRQWALPQWFARMATPGMDATTSQAPDDEQTTATSTTGAPPSGARRQLTNPPNSDDVTPPEIRPTEGARAARRRGGRGRRPQRPSGSWDEES